jgi:hypothetical protein
MPPTPPTLHVWSGIADAALARACSNGVEAHTVVFRSDSGATGFDRDRQVARRIDPDELRRAARLSLVPGASVDAIARETGVSPSAIRRARKALALTRDDLLLAALTANGTRAEGSIGEDVLTGVASWLDYVNHDGSTAASVRADLDRLAEAGRIALDGARFRLLVPWP